MSTASVPEKPLFDAGPIALGAFASSTLILSSVNVNFVDKTTFQAVIASAWVMGGLVQLLVGIYSLTVGRLFASVAFMSYGGFWLSFAVFETFYVSKVPLAEHGHATALFLAPWLIFTIILWIASFKTSMAFVIGVGLLVLTIAALILGQANTNENWIKIGGWLGLVLALEIFYIAGAELINQMFGRHILPLGEFSTE
jgi:succinate-acetate transporter protein